MCAIYFKFAWVLAVLTMGFEPSRGIPSVEEYFKDRIPNGDVSKVTWAHAVNSQELLQKALKKDEVMMLEADILMGTKNGGNGTKIPIMAQPPQTSSDLSFDDFLSEVIKAVGTKNVKKGIKLDFKDDKAVKSVLKALNKTTVDFPLWLNADILPGPVDSKNGSINGSKFLTSCQTRFPEGTLSAGWVTRYGWDDTKKVDRKLPVIKVSPYTLEQANDMLRLLKESKVDISQNPVTFPLRAGLAAISIEFIQRLLEAGKTSITLWSAVDDDVDMNKLHKVISIIGPTRCFIDLPFPLESGPKDSSRPANCDIHPEAVEVHNHDAEVDNAAPTNPASQLTTASSVLMALLFLGFATYLN